MKKIRSNKLFSLLFSFYVVWLTSIVSFIWISYNIATNENGQYSDLVSQILIILILIGVSSFIFFCFFFLIDLIRHKFKVIKYISKHNKAIKFGVIIFVITFIYGAINIIQYVSNNSTNTNLVASEGISGNYYDEPEEDILEKIIEQSNIERKKIGVSDLIKNEKLDEAAKLKLEHMVDNNYWSHTAPDGTEPWDFFRNVSYDYEFAGENLAKGFSTAQDTVKSWMNSEKHRENILNNNYTQIGVAYTYDNFQGVNQVVIVQLFGKPMSKSNINQPINSNVNPNEPIHCNVHPNCGGGTKPLTRSECENSICCGVGDNKWEFYTDKSKCSSATNSNSNQQNNSSKVPVFNSYGGYTMYCDPQNVSAAQSIISSMESKKSEWTNDYLSCTDRFYDTNSCYQSCSSSNSSARSICYENYGYSGPEYEHCSKTADDGYSSCIENCPSAFDECDWVYFEQKSLSSQLRELCI